MKILVIGSGAREHALTWALSRSPSTREIFVAPGNPGTAGIAKNVPIKVESVSDLLSFAREEKIDLTVVGPEFPLTLGIVDAFREKGLKIFGPTSSASKLESSKSFAKEIMTKAGVKTAEYQSFNSLHEAQQYITSASGPFVLKADGLAAGKGVVVCKDLADAKAGLGYLFTELKSRQVLIERFLRGKEASFIVATNGSLIVPFASSHDYKRVFDHDRGPNTGGMGSVSPTARLTQSQEEQAIKQVIEPVLREMQRSGNPFSGFLYAGLMIEDDGTIWVLEFNARFGDPECQSVVRRLESDLALVLAELCKTQSADGQFEVRPLSWSNQKAVCVVLASEGYPEKPRLGDEITGLQKAAQIPDVLIFHAGTSLDKQGRLVTSGGRVLSVTAVASSYEDARRLAYQACDIIDFKGKHLRHDIAA